mgnify:CR=1 FL=1
MWNLLLAKISAYRVDNVILVSFLINSESLFWRQQFSQFSLTYSPLKSCGVFVEYFFMNILVSVISIIPLFWRALLFGIPKGREYQGFKYLQVLFVELSALQQNRDNSHFIVMIDQCDTYLFDVICIDILSVVPGVTKLNHWIVAHPSHLVLWFTSCSCEP